MYLDYMVYQILPDFSLGFGVISGASARAKLAKDC